MAGKQKLSRFSYVIFNLVAKLSEASTSRPAHLFWLPISCNMAISFYISVEAAPHSVCYKTILHDFTVCHFQDMTLYSNASTWSNNRALLGCAATISDGHRVLTSIKEHLKTSKNWFKRFRTCWLHKLCRCTCTALQVPQHVQFWHEQLNMANHSSAFLTSWEVYIFMPTF